MVESTVVEADAGTALPSIMWETLPHPWYALDSVRRSCMSKHGMAAFSTILDATAQAQGRALQEQVKLWMQQWGLLVAMESPGDDAPAPDDFQTGAGRHFRTSHQVWLGTAESCRYWFSSDELSALASSGRETARDG